MDRRTAISMIALGLAAEGTSAAEAPPSSGGIKFMVLYGHPPNPAEFEKYYLGVHMPLVFVRHVEWKLDDARIAPECGGDFQIAIERMLLRRADVDATRVEDRRKLARVCKTDPRRRARLPRQPAAAKQALKIDNEIERAPAELFLK